MLRLVLPDTKFWDSYVEALREGYQFGSRPIPTEEQIKGYENDPLAHLESLNRQGGFFTPEDGIERKRVPDNTYWLIDSDEFIGAINIRYELNDFLEKYAGHAGYGVRPSKRRQGYARKMLGLALSKLKERDVFYVMVTADEVNIASWKVIEANGGVLDGTIKSIYEEGQTTRQYWIDMKEGCG